jgi:hypothetical protein
MLNSKQTLAKATAYFGFADFKAHLLLVAVAYGQYPPELTALPLKHGEQAVTATELARVTDVTDTKVRKADTMLPEQLPQHLDVNIPSAQAEYFPVVVLNVLGVKVVPATLTDLI